MAHRFAELMFSPAAKALQEASGSRASYARLAGTDAPANDQFGPRETAFIGARDSFYMASATPDGWPYVQHRGGPPGFLKVLDGRTLGFAEYPGNKQFVSLGNLATDDRVSLFLMDYPNRRRLKVLGHAWHVDAGHAPALVARIAGQDQPSPAVAIIVTLEGFDWNCPQYITPRYTEAELTALLAPTRAQIAALEQENARLRHATAALGQEQVS